MIFSFAKEKSTGAKVYNLGSGTSIDVSHIDGFEELTADNFLIVPTSGFSASTGHHFSGEGEAHVFRAYGGYNIATKSYNASTGILIVTQATMGASIEKSYSTVESKSAKGTHTVYLIIGEIG